MSPFIFLIPVVWAVLGALYCGNMNVDFPTRDMCLKKHIFFLIILGPLGYTILVGGITVVTPVLKAFSKWAGV